MEGNISLRQLKSGSQFLFISIIIYIHSSLIFLTCAILAENNKQSTQHHRGGVHGNLHEDLCVFVPNFWRYHVTISRIEIEWYACYSSFIRKIRLICSQPQRTDDFQFYFDRTEFQRKPSQTHTLSKWLDICLMVYVAELFELLGNFHNVPCEGNKMEQAGEYRPTILGPFFCLFGPTTNLFAMSILSISDSSFNLVFDFNLSIFGWLSTSN